MTWQRLHAVLRACLSCPRQHRMWDESNNIFILPAWIAGQTEGMTVKNYRMFCSQSSRWKVSVTWWTMHGKQSLPITFWAKETTPYGWWRNFFMSILKTNLTCFLSDQHGTLSWFMTTHELLLEIKDGFHFRALERKLCNSTSLKVTDSVAMALRYQSTSVWHHTMWSAAAALAESLAAVVRGTTAALVALGHLVSRLTG